MALPGLLAMRLRWVVAMAWECEEGAASSSASKRRNHVRVGKVGCRHRAPSAGGGGRGGGTGGSLRPAAPLIGRRTLCGAACGSGRPAAGCEPRGGTGCPRQALARPCALLLYCGSRKRLQGYQSHVGPGSRWAGELPLVPAGCWAQPRLLHTL